MPGQMPKANAKGQCEMSREGYIHLRMTCALQERKGGHIESPLDGMKKLGKESDWPLPFQEILC